MLMPALLRFRPFDEGHAREVLAWKYAPPYAIYDLPGGDSVAAIEQMLGNESPYLAVLDERDELIAFRCFGAEARVRGGDYAEEALDLGGGLRPDLTGWGLGRHIIAAAMNYGFERFRPRLFRTTVASFNVRARKACERVGYLPVSAFERPSDGLEFVILQREAGLNPLSIPMRNGE